MTELQVRQGYANGTLTDCDECGATMKNGGECEVCKNRVSCDQCQLVMIQGVLCHETGCVNTYSRYDADSGEWVKQRKCDECGCTVDATDSCCNAQDSEFHLADAECGLDEDEEDGFDEHEDTQDEIDELYDEDEDEHEDTDSLEDRGLTLGSYAS